MEKSDCKPELKNSQACLSHDRLKRLQGPGTLNARNVPSVPEDTNPELAIGKQQDSELRENADQALCGIPKGDEHTCVQKYTDNQKDLHWHL